MSSYQSQSQERTVNAAQIVPKRDYELAHDDDFQQLAMTISEEIARLSNSHAPIPIDLPLVQAGLSKSALSSLRSWLQSFYDYNGDIQSLSNHDVSAETLAHTLTSAHRVNGDAGKRRRRLRPRNNLSVDIKKGNELDHPAVVPTQSPSPVVPRERRQVPAPGRIIVPDELEDVDIGMASYESWCGKKTGMVAGLLALAMLGSPTTHVTRDAYNGLERPNLFINPQAPLLDVLSPFPQSRSLLSPWLDVVHFEGLEPIQSPWVADHSEFFDLNVPQNVSP